MIINMYELTLRSDDGLRKITTSASNPEQAIKQVCDAENAPQSAVIKVSPVDVDFNNVVKEKLQKTIDDQFKIVRKSALANPVLYNFRYTQKDCKEAKIEYLMSTLINTIMQKNKIKEQLTDIESELKKVKKQK